MLKAVEASRREGKFEDAGDRLLTQAENLALDSAANVQVQLRENPSQGSRTICLARSDCGGGRALLKFVTALPWRE